MRAFKALMLAVIMVAGVVALPGAALADPVEPAVSTFDWTNNLHPLGFSARENTISPFTANSDIAFWGKIAYQGNYDGFRILDVTEPDNPVELNDYRDCAGNQGDVLIWEHLLVRSWNSPAPAGATCDGEPVDEGFEGLHVFDVSDPADPDLVSSVAMDARAFLVTVDPPSSAEGTYRAVGAAFGPAPTAAGLSGSFELASDGVGVVTDGCESFSVTAGAIALVDRGACNFTVKVKNAQNGGASAVVVVNTATGGFTTMAGTDPTITIPSVMVTFTDGTAIKNGLPATGSIASDPDVLFGCGSHTATLVPDVEAGRLLVYNSASSGACPGIDIVEIPLGDPEDATFLRREPSGRSCHDTGVILGDAMLAACAGGNGFTVWSMDPDDGGTLTDPAQLYSNIIPGVTIGHSAAFTWDGEVLIFGWEPGGGAAPRCQSTSSQVDRTLFFFEADTGASLGSFVNTRFQTAAENCTWHNYNVVPTDRGYILVSALYQGGFSVVDFTDPSAAAEIGFADPAPLVPTQLGGDWSTYWYDGRIYQSDITRGLLIWEFSSSSVAAAERLDHLNPQTQEFTL